MGQPLILHRYINRQVFLTTVMVTFILVMVLVSGRFIKYLAEAAAGEIAADALFLVMAFRMPEFLADDRSPESLYRPVAGAWAHAHG
ncbi:LptF/LptG family permease [Alcanivorax sp. IL3]|uniref:LptF/LptG family permease n=1 Tax=Alcanivorax sp. IL3 TaxID=3396309 RepID=UPI0039C1610A